MFRLVAIVLFFLTPGLAYAEVQDCADLRIIAKTLDERTSRLIGTYKDEVSVFGFSKLMVKEKNHEDAGENILRMAGLARGCTTLIEGKSCHHVSKEIISLISNGVRLCVADKKSQCGIC